MNVKPLQLYEGHLYKLVSFGFPLNKRATEKNGAIKLNSNEHVDLNNCFSQFVIGVFFISVNLKTDQQIQITNLAL